MKATDLCLAEARLRAVSLSEVVSAAPSLSSLKGMLYTPELSNRFMVCKCVVWLVCLCVSGAGAGLSGTGTMLPMVRTPHHGAATVLRRPRAAPRTAAPRTGHGTGLNTEHRTGEDGYVDNI